MFYYYINDWKIWKAAVYNIFTKVASENWKNTEEFLPVKSEFIIQHLSWEHNGKIKFDNYDYATRFCPIMQSLHYL